MNEPVRVFIVDDEAALLDAISRLLKHDGYVVETFRSPSLAIEAASADPPEFLITDFLMGEMSGAELAVEVRMDLRRRSPKIICVTGWISELRPEQTRLFDRVLEKPFAYCDLVRLLDDMENGHASREGQRRISGTQLRAAKSPFAMGDDETLDEAVG